MRSLFLTLFACTLLTTSAASAKFAELNESVKVIAESTHETMCELGDPLCTDVRPLPAPERVLLPKMMQAPDRQGMSFVGTGIPFEFPVLDFLSFSGTALASTLTCNTVNPYMLEKWHTGLYEQNTDAIGRMQMSAWYRDATSVGIIGQLANESGSSFVKAGPAVNC